MWTDRGDGWLVAIIQGHELKLRQTGPSEFQVSIDGQGQTRRLQVDTPLVTLQMSLARTALMLPPR